jgi:hypothetical protein
MVRTKEKKAKGDSAFTKQKQKVGRKKLAPATATRAEVHARTLRLATSTAMTAAMAAPHAADPATHPASSATTTAGQRAAATDKRKRPVIAVQNFSELLAGTHHYKSAQRASAFATLTRLLIVQREKEAAAAAAFSAGTRGGVTGAFDEYMRYAAAKNAAATDAATAGAASSSSSPPSPAGGLTGLTALEKLKAFAAALEAVTDTDDDVRRGALQSLEVLVDHQWVSPDREGAANAGAAGTSASENAGARARLSLSSPTSSPAAATNAAAATTQDAAELAYCNALLMDIQAGHQREAEHVLATALPSSFVGAAAAVSSTASMDRVQAILQAVHVALTHALKPVRLSGVELLAILLRVTPPALLRAAARAVCRHQMAYYYSGPVAMGNGLAMAGVQSTAPKSVAATSNTTSELSSSASALKDAQSRAASLVEEEERWMLMLVRRVSTLVLRTKYVAVLPTLLDVFLGQGGDDASSAGEFVVAALLRSCLDGRGIVAGGSGAGAHPDPAALTTPCMWHHPELVNHFFDEVAPQWANHWKELMELRLELLRHEEKLAMASALARAFATVLVFLKRQQQQQRACAKSNATNFFSRSRMYYIKALFIEKMPVTMHELLIPSRGGNSSSLAPPAVGPRGMKARLELGLALAMVCVPLAGTDDGWRLMRDYFSIVFSSPQHTPHVAGSDAADTPPPFRFPSVVLLEMSVRLYEQVLRLYPCITPHVCLMDDEAATASDSATAAAAVWGGGFASTVSFLAATTCKRAGMEKAKSSLSAEAEVQQHSTVAVRLLSFFPALLTTVIKHAVPRTDSAAMATSAVSVERGSEDAALARSLLCTSQIVERWVVFPADLLRRRGDHGSRPQSGASDGCATAKTKLEEGFGLVPRLLFALREHTSVARPACVKRPRNDDEAGNRSSDTAAEEPQGSPASLSGETRVGVLLAYPGIVDAIVRRLLRVLWFLCSSGHPLRTCPGTSSPTAFALQLKTSILLLFGMKGSGVPGVLERCAVPTVLLAHSILYYLGETTVKTAGKKSDSFVDGRTTLEVAAERWVDVLEGMQTRCA